MSLILATLLAAGQADTLRLPDLVTTATRLPVPAASLPSAHTVISGVELRERGVTRLLDALRDVPGLVTVQAGSHGAATSLFLRGGESDYVKILVDGVPMNAPGGAFNLANLPVENIDRIEVVRGPASVVHGADAMTGVVQVFTRSGEGRLSPSLDVETGGLSSQRMSAGISGSARAGSVSLQAGTVTSDGLYPFNSEYRQWNFSSRLASPEATRVQAHLTARYGDVRAGFPTDFAGELADSNQYLTERQLAVGLGMRWRVSPATILHLSGTAARTWDAFVDVPDHPGDASGFAFAATRDGRVHRTGGELRVVHAPGGPWTLTTGLQYEDERQRQAGSTTSDFGTGPFTSEDQFRAQRSTRTLYAEAARRLGSRVTLQGGARLDDNSAFGTAGTWRLGGSLTAGRGFTVRFQAGRAFKAPTFPELFADSPFEVGNPELQPEHSRAWEVGAEQVLAGGGLRLAATWFDQRFRDLIQYGSAAPGEPTYANVAAATSRGLEVGTTALIGPQLTLTTQVTILATEVVDGGTEASVAFEEGSRLLRRPDITAAVAVRWTPTPGSLLRLDVHHLGSRDDGDYAAFPARRVELGPRTTTDLAAAVRLPDVLAGLWLTGRVENLFDARWEQVLGFPARGRTAHFGVRAGR